MSVRGGSRPVVRREYSASTVEGRSRHELSYQAGGNPPEGMVTTSGTLKLRTNQWADNNAVRAAITRNTRYDGERLRQRARELEQHVRISTQQKQVKNTELIQKRSQDVEYWRYELNRSIREIRDETELLCQQKLRLEKSLAATEIPLNIASESLRLRDRRLLPDQVADNVEENLHREVDLIKNAQDLLMKTIDQATIQINKNRESKLELEEDWSQADEALSRDVSAGVMHNASAELQYKPGVATYPDKQSDPVDWSEMKSMNLSQCEGERQNSEQLRALIDQILTDISTDLTEQNDEVQHELNVRIDEMEEVKKQQQDLLNREIIREIVDVEKNINELNKSVQALEGPMKVAQSRLNIRQQRPNIENSRDPPHIGLVEEVGDLGSAADNLHHTLLEAENSLKNLQNTRDELDRDITTKANSIFIDRNKCLAMRRRYPTQNKLMGY